jgi:hypothetical protein
MRRAARCGSADFRSAATGKTKYGGFQLDCPYPAPLRSEPRSEFPTQPLPLSVPIIDESAFDGVRGLSQKHTSQIGGPGACRRRRSSGPGGGCARTLVGTHLHLLVVDVGNLMAMPCLARLGARRSEIRRLRSADEELS